MNTRLLALLIIICGVLGTQKIYAQDEEKKSLKERVDEANETDLYIDDDAVQGRNTKKLDRALVNLMETDFMKAFISMRIRAEGAAAAFKAIQIDYTPQDVTRVKISYTKVANAFNKKLNDIKLDFLNGQKLKMIRKFPDMYSGGIANEMQTLRNLYSQNFQLTLQEVTGGDIDGSFLPLLIGVVELASKLSNHFAKLNYNKRTITNEYMEDNFIEPNKFPHWDDIIPSEGTTDDYYNNWNNNSDENEDDSTDYLNNPFSPKDTTKVKKKKNGDGN